MFLLAAENGNHLLLDLGYALVAAFVGGVVAERFKQPALVGYMLAGILIGPYTPGPVSDPSNVSTLAEIGVALLMFGLGSEFSVGQLAQVRNGAVFGGILQILLTIGLGVGVGYAIGLDTVPGVFLGAILALSSSVVIIKVQMGRGEMDALATKLAIGVAIIQDISLVPMMVILPSLADTGREPLALLADIGLATLTAALFLGITYALGTRIVPKVLQQVAAHSGGEVFLLTVSVVALGTALLAQAAGISFAIGAFLGGLMVSESELAHHALERIEPLRDLFAAIFFVSVGMLIDPFFVITHVPLELLLIVVVLLGKFAIAGGLFLVFRYSLPVATKSALLLTQIGEFSFVLAALGVERGIISNDLKTAILAAALLTIVATPAVVQRAEQVAGLLARLPGLRKIAERGGGELVPASSSGGGTRPLNDLRGHVVVCGYGRVGRELVDALQRRGFVTLVIEIDPYAVQRAARDGVNCIYGDAAEPIVLERAGLERARVLAVAVPDAHSAERITLAARQRYKRLPIIARAEDFGSIPLLYNVGAGDVIQPEVEAGLEFVRRTLRKMGMSQVEIHGVLAGRRARTYQILAGREVERTAAEEEGNE